MSAGAYGYAKVCLDEAIAYARERHTFGKPLIANQVVRHRLVDMAMRINAVKSSGPPMVAKCTRLPSTAISTSSTSTLTTLPLGTPAAGPIDSINAPASPR